VITQGAFADLIFCLTQFSKNHKFQKKSLQAIELLKSAVPKLLKTPECSLSRKSNGEPDGNGTPNQSQEEQYWFPILFAFHDVLMTGEDLEVRSRALNYLFETLMKYGGDFPLDFWDIVLRQLLLPIFMVLRSKSEMSKVVVHEELSVWLSTTLVQALRNMITLFTHFFKSLEYMLEGFLDLLILCIYQENDTLARIGSNCLQQLILQNVMKFSDQHWHKVVDAFVKLFEMTEATALFSAAAGIPFTPSLSAPSNGTSLKSPQPDAQSFDNLSLHSVPFETPRSEISDPTQGLGINNLDALQADPEEEENERATLEAEDTETTNGNHATPKTSYQNEVESYKPDPSLPVSGARRKFFNQIITQCVLTLLMIETVNELLSDDNVYSQMPSMELLRLMGMLKKSYHFARRFNNDRDLRTRLFKEGFMKQPPNLLKQESGSAATYVAILFRMYHDPTPGRVGTRAQTEAALVPLCVDILKSYLELDDETQGRNIQTWRPVVIDVLEGCAGFDKPDLQKHIGAFGPLVVGLLGRELNLEFQAALQKVVGRIIEVSTDVDCGGYMMQWDGRTSRRASSMRSPRV
jgi:brefeldin A-inhibited guanine nucleotide-exchange protein